MNIGLVLSGGMAKGAYQIGALKAMKEFIPRNEIKLLSCSSIGVLSGYAYVTDKLAYAEEMWKNICEDDTRLLLRQVLKSNMLYQSICGLCSQKHSFDTDLYCTLFNVNSRIIVYKNLAMVQADQIPVYLKASIAIPFYNRAVRIDTDTYFDGAFVDNIPIYPLLKRNLDYIICMHFDDKYYKFENTYLNNKIIQIKFPCDNTIKQSVIFNAREIDTMLRDGFDSASVVLNSVFHNGYEDTEYIYKAIEYINSHNNESSLRVTVDMLATNLNKMAQKFAKRRLM